MNISLPTIGLTVSLLAMGIRPAPKPPEPTTREKLLEVAKSQVGVREATGRNDGEVDKYLRAVGLGGSHAPYCAAFVYWVGRTALGNRNPIPKSAWSPTMVRGGVPLRGSLKIKGGETFGIWFRSKGRVAHTGFIEKVVGDSVVTIEANTSPKAAYGSNQDRDGQGVYRKIRPRTTIYRVKDWL
jgi:hypothetical protein